MSHSYIDPKNDYYNYNDNSDTTQKKIDPVAQLKWLNTPQVHGEWGLFHNQSANNETVQMSAQDEKQGDKTFTVPSGWKLQKIANHLGVTVDILKVYNKDKIKSWSTKAGGTIEGFNAGERITYPNTSEAKDQLMPSDIINEAYKKFSSSEIDMIEFAESLLPFTSTHSSLIIDIFNLLPKNYRDNLAYIMANHSKDSELNSFNKSLLLRMSIELGGIFNTLSWIDNWEQKNRIDHILNQDNAEGAVEDDKNVYNKDALDAGIDFVNENKEAYLEGDERWESGKKDKKNYNNILVVHKDEADGNHLKVYRNFSGGVYTLIGTETLDDAKYLEEKELASFHNTYCNIAATKIGLGFGAPNIQNYGGTEHNANAIYDNFVNKFYNTETHVFKEVNFDEAEKYANSGGLAYAIWKKSGGTGHIGTLIGGYGGDGEKSMANLKIFQAGNTFGYMNYSQGFGSRESKFFIWIKK